MSHLLPCMSQRAQNTSIPTAQFTFSLARGPTFCDLKLTLPSGTFLTAAPSGTLTATSVSRGPLEGFTATLEEGSLFPSVALKTNSGTYLSVPPADAEDIKAKKAEIRGDAETSTGDSEKLRIKCQREFVFKARMAALEAKEAGTGKRRLFDSGPALGSVEDEMSRKWVSSLSSGR